MVRRRLSRTVRVVSVSTTTGGSGRRVAQSAGRRQRNRGLLTWGFSRQWLISVFHVVGFLMWRGRGLDGQRAPSSSWKPVFPAARGCQGAKLARGDAHGAPLAAPSRRESYEHESDGAAVGRRVCADRVDFSVSSVSPLVARNLRSWAEPLERSGR